MRRSDDERAQSTADLCSRAGGYCGKELLGMFRAAVAENDRLRAEVAWASELWAKETVMVHAMRNRAEAAEVEVEQLRDGRAWAGYEATGVEVERDQLKAQAARVQAELDAIDNGEHATTGRQDGQGMAFASKLIRAATNGPRQ